RADGRTDDGGVANAGRLVDDALHVFRKDVQSFRRDDHFLLAPADVELTVLPDLADVSRVKPPVLERTRRFHGIVEISARDVFAAHENFAVGRDLHVDAGHGLADGTLLGAERMVEADDRRGLGEPVPLNHRKAQFAPERFQFGIEWSRADDERPELQSEQAMDAAIAPPTLDEVLAGTGHVRLRRHAAYVLAQHVENLWH